MFRMPADEYEIKRITGNLLSTKSPDYDDISPEVPFRIHRIWK